MKRSAPLQRRTPLRRGKPLKRGAPLKRTGSLKRRRRRKSSAETDARLHFEAIVLAKPCFFADLLWEDGPPRRPGHACDGDCDAHHLIAKSWIQKYFNDLPEDELLAIKYAPIIGCPLCRGGHDALPANLKRGRRVYFDELDPDLIDFCERIDERYALPSRPSILARLEIECPKREAGSPASERSSA